MSAKHALLGLLLDRPAYPYQLADRVQRRLGPAWEVNSGQLYQTVKALERDGLIARVRGAAGEREDRHVFAITDDGVREFERWFEQAPEPVRLPRRPLLAKITFAGPGRLERALAKLDAYERACAGRLAEIARLRDDLPFDVATAGSGDPGDGKGDPPGAGALVRADELLLRLNLSTDVLQLEGELRWAARARELMAWLSENEALWPSPRERAPSGGQAGAQTKTGGRERARAGARRELFERMAGSDPPDDA